METSGGDADGTGEDEGSGEKHVGAEFAGDLAALRLGGDDGVEFVDGAVVSGDPPLADDGIVAGDDPSVAGNGVPGFEENDVPRDDLGGGEQEDPAVPDHGADGDARPGHVLEDAVRADIDRRPDQGSEDEHGDDGSGFEAFVEKGGCTGGGGEEDGGEVEKGGDGGFRSGGLPHVPDPPPDLMLSLLRLRGVQTPEHVGPEEVQHLAAEKKMPGV